MMAIFGKMSVFSKTSILLLSTLLLALLTISTSANTKVTVQTKLGPIEGEATRVGRAFTRIRFAHADRFENPVPVDPWTTTISAVGDLPSCPQICELPKETCAPKDAMTEDCLFLNIFTPLNVAGARLPVLIWYHGGRYQQGYAGGDLYNSEELATNAIVVSINYRLGALGYLYAPDLGVSGNFGLKDQILGLQFVRQIIADFGGDVNKITISGQSAGAGSVAAILSTPTTHGMYKNAILFSNPFTIPIRTTTSQIQYSTAFVNQTGCKEAEQQRDCINQVSLDTVYTAQVDAVNEAILSGFYHKFLPYTPTAGTTDGLLPLDPFNTFKQGKIPKDIGIIIGTTSDEAPMFIYGGFEKPVDHGAYLVSLGAILGLERLGKVLKKFPGSKDIPDHREILVQVANEYIFEYSNNYLSTALINSRENESDKLKIFNYRYSHVFEDETIWDHLKPLCGKTACHAAELPIIFRNSKIYQRIRFSTDEMAFTTDVHKQLLNFLWTSNPNKGPVQALPWEPFKFKQRRMHWECNAFEMLEIDSEAQSFWDDVGYM